MKLVKKKTQKIGVEDTNNNKDKSKNKYRIDCLELSVTRLEQSIDEIKKSVSRLRSNLDSHVNRKFTEIRVLPEGKNPNKSTDWEDYSGDFYLEDADEEALVLEKAKKHFETYFKDGIYHRNKKLGLFLSTQRSGKRLIETIKTDK